MNIIRRFFRRQSIAIAKERIIESEQALADAQGELWLAQERLRRARAGL